MRAWLVGGMVVMLAAAGRAQTAVPPSDYPAAVQAYVGLHDAARAVAGLVGWTPNHFASAIEKYPAQPQPRLAAAAVLQIEIGHGLALDAPALAARHLELGHRLVREMLATRRNVPPMSIGETAAFAERWYVAAASTLLMVNDATRAAPFVSRGLQLAPASPDLRLMTGIMDDLFALSLNPDDSFGGNARIRIVMSRTQAFMRARSKYADLVKDSPAFVKARIRLGRVLWMLDDGDAGRRWSAASSRDLRELFVRVLEELLSRYLLTYSPAGVAGAGWHDVKVTLKGARGDVIARPGYFVAAK